MLSDITYEFMLTDITVSYTYTYHDSSSALELTVLGFMEGKKRQTAGSCKLSSIWDRKALLSAPWPVAALQRISSSLCTSAHHLTPSVLHAWAAAQPTLGYSWHHRPQPEDRRDC